MKKYSLHFLVFGSVLVAVFVSWLCWPKLLPMDTLEHQGQYGDSFGPLNTLFTGLAFAGVAFSIFLQIHEGAKREHERNMDLKAAEQEKELERRDRMQQQAERERDKRAEAVEARFFKMTDSLRAVVSSMTTHETTGNVARAPYTGKDVFGVYLYRMQQGFQPATSVTEIIDRYQEMYRKQQDDLAPYFRMLYHIVRYVDRAPTSNGKDYIDIVRAELSSTEVCLLAANGLTPQGKKFFPLIVKYGLLKHLPKNVAVSKTLIEPVYGRAAFEEDDAHSTTH